MKYVGEIKCYILVLLTLKFSRIQGRWYRWYLIIKIMFTTHLQQLADEDW